VAHRPAERLRERGRHLGAGQVLAGDADGLADENSPPRLKMPSAQRPMSSAAMPGQLRVAGRQDELERAVGGGLRPMPKWIRLSQ